MVFQIQKQDQVETFEKSAPLHVSDILTALTDCCKQRTFRADGAGNFGGCTVGMYWGWWYHPGHIFSVFWVLYEHNLRSTILRCGFLRVQSLISILFSGFHAEGYHAHVCTSRPSRQGLPRPSSFSGNHTQGYHTLISRQQAITPTCRVITPRAITLDQEKPVGRVITPAGTSSYVVAVCGLSRLRLFISTKGGTGRTGVLVTGVLATSILSYVRT